MVRKTVSQTTNQPAPQVAPYPITPISPTQKLQQTTIASTDGGQEGFVPSKEQEVEASQGPNPWLSGDNDAWHGNDRRAKDTQLPTLLRAGGERQNADKTRDEGIPSLLQAGSTEDTPRSSLESQASIDPKATALEAPIQSPRHSKLETTSSAYSNNPYHHLPSTSGQALEQPAAGLESSTDVWGDDQVLPPPQHEQEPIRHPYSERWMDFETSPVVQGVPGPEAQRHTSADGSAFSSFPDQTNGLTDVRAADAPILDIQSPGQVSQSPRSHGVDRDPIYPTGAPIQEPSPPAQDFDYNHHDTLEEANNAPQKYPNNDDIGPPLPPRKNSQEKQEDPPPEPPRPPKTSDVQSDESLDVRSQQNAESIKAKRARETYQIRHVNWYDASSPTNPRRSPIMVQNANGPCPLLALVNALVLSTPADYATALVETLRLREQVSLGLLLDAVIDELIGRNGDLPDVSDMYAFLVTLHTGMNVNPRFIPLESTMNLMDAPIEEELPGNLLESRKAGGFEDTREMKLYSTFAIPLIHGWIPPRNHPAFVALKRAAKTYEDAQNLMFREEELEEKLRQQGLDPEEQITLEDIASVKYFLSSTATQLTGYGLDSMTETMKPGSIAILFRNDHFSTLYRHPKSGQLLTLVIDMGYAGHDEVVWESLVDVSGEGCEFFSGDFRPVGNNPDDTQQPPQPQDAKGWTTVPPRSRRPPALSTPQPSLNPNDTKHPPLSPSTEQEDHDLALALQLQDEEEEHNRRSAAARRREDELSQAYLNSSDASGRRTFPGFSTGARAANNSNNSARGGPSPPPRGRGRGAPPSSGGGRQAPPARKSIDTEDAPPPSYEQAAKNPAYHPPAYHPAHPYAAPRNPSTSNTTNHPPRPLPTRPHRQSSAYTEHAASYTPPSPSPSPYTPQQPPSRRGGQHNPRGSGSSYAAPMRGGSGGVDPGMARRRSAGVGAGDEERRERDGGKEKDCVVM